MTEQCISHSQSVNVKAYTVSVSMLRFTQFRCQWKGLHRVRVSVSRFTHSFECWWHGWHNVWDSVKWFLHNVHQYKQSARSKNKTFSGQWHLWWQTVIIAKLEEKTFKSRVPDQNGVSQAWYIVEIHQSGRQPSKYAKYPIGLLTLRF